VTTALMPGMKIDSIEISAVLGAGEGAIVYSGLEAGSDVPVVMKEFFPFAKALRSSSGTQVVACGEESETFAADLQAFITLYETLGDLAHPSLPRVRRVVRANETAYAVYAYHSGETLEAHALKAPGMFESRIRAIFSPLLDALGRVHEHGITHLGLYPGNIWLPSAGAPILFGFRPRGVDDPVGPQMQGFAPLEQRREHRADGYRREFADDQTGDAQVGPWTDLHALGMSMLRCICGRPPATVSERIRELETTGADPVRRALEQEWRRFSADFLDAVSWMTQYEPGSRPVSAQAVMHVLNPHEPAWVPEGTGFSGAAAPLAGPQGSYAPDAPVDGPALDALIAAMQAHVGPLAGAVVRRALSLHVGEDHIVAFLLENVPPSEHVTSTLLLERLVEEVGVSVRGAMVDGSMEGVSGGAYGYGANSASGAGRRAEVGDSPRTSNGTQPQLWADVSHDADTGAGPQWDIGGEHDDSGTEGRDLGGWASADALERAQASAVGGPGGDLSGIPDFRTNVMTAGDELAFAQGFSLAQIEQALATVVGPISTVMVRRALDEGAIETLVDHLSGQINAPKLHDAFHAALAATASARAE
jgi:hypothetical protein